MEATEKSLAIIATLSSTISRLKREDCTLTKHDSAFSQWKVLIGPSDWEDHSNGKEGAERYRTQNLPNCASCTGVYELGIAVWRRKNGREGGKLDPDFVVPVYLGKSDNVRYRLQQYGRKGAHLENGSSNTRLSDCDEILAQKGPGLFRDIFSNGFSIVYRWAPMKSTRDAEKTESDLLDKFDYAWNKGSNGPRRPNDILKELGRISKSSPFLAKLQLLSQKKKGIKIKAYEPPFLENGLNFYTNTETNGLLRWIFKFNRSQPKLIVRHGTDENYTSICGVALGHGVTCKRAPVEGNKRCSEHKGMKINGFSSKLLTDGKSTSAVDEYPISKEFTPVCGVILDDGSCCTNEPVQGNKRCLEHKGRKICLSTPQVVKDNKERYVYGPILDCDVSTSRAGKQYIGNDCSTIVCGIDLDDGTFCTRQPLAGRKRCEEHREMRIKKTISTSPREKIPSMFEDSGYKSSSEKSHNHSFIPSVFDDKISPICGAATHDGSFCRRKPMEGNKRCWQHKDIRVDASPRSSPCNYSRHNHSFIPSVFDDKSSPTCGAATHDGSFCRRKPMEGNKRCWQHKDMRVDASPRSSPCNNSRQTIPSPQYGSYSSVCEDFSSSCGAALQNGSFCSRTPTKGNKRCWQHKGMRADSSPGTSDTSRYYSHSSHRASYGFVYGNCSSTCGAPTRSGSYCRRSTSGGRCWQHGG